MIYERGLIFEFENLFLTHFKTYPSLYIRHK